MNKLIPFLMVAAILMFICAQPLSAQTDNPEPKIYKGYRLSLFGFKVVSQNSKSITIKYSVVNTGRQVVNTSPKSPFPDYLIVELDSLNVPKLLSGKEQNIVWAFSKEETNLMPGQMEQNLTLKVPFQLPQPDKKAAPPIAQRPPNKNEVNKNAPTKEKTLDKETTETASSSLPQESKKKKKETAKQTESDVCVDLVFDSVMVVSKTDKYMTLRFVILNTSDAPANLLGRTNNKEDNLAVNVYFTSGTKLTRGSLLADGMFFKNKELEAGILPPGKRIWGELEIGLQERTKFTPNLVFELDPFQTINECDKTNNTKALVLQ